MKVEPGPIEGVLLIEPKVLGDERGFFLETFHAERYAAAGITGPFVQDNVSRSAPGALRGLHLQCPREQAKLVWVLEGQVLDVAVDVRVGSPTFGRHVAEVLDAERKNQLYIPSGFAHGFCVLGESPATVVYKCSEHHDAENEIAVLWSDPALEIDWPLKSPILSARDSAAPRLQEIVPDRLPRYRG